MANEPQPGSPAESDAKVTAPANNQSEARQEAADPKLTATPRALQYGRDGQPIRYRRVRDK